MRVPCGVDHHLVVEPNPKPHDKVFVGFFRCESAGNRSRVQLQLFYISHLDHWKDVNEKKEISKSTCQPRQPVSLMNLSFTACLTKSYPPWGKNFLVLRMRSSRVSSLYFRLFFASLKNPSQKLKHRETMYPKQKKTSKKEKN